MSLFRKKPLDNRGTCALRVVMDAMTRVTERMGGIADSRGSSKRLTRTP
jgi:hypothetical protein